jgi:antitoxin component of MazEF toxin-antitoxin module
VTLPKDIVQDLRWRQGQKVVVSREGDALVIRDWKPGRRSGAAG